MRGERTWISIDETPRPQTLLNSIVQFIILPIRLLNKNPILFKRKNFHIVSYGLFAAIEAVLVILFVSYFLYLKGVRLPHKLIPLLPLLGLIIFTCSSVISLIPHRKKYDKDRKKLFHEIGSNVHGGIIGGIIAGLIASNYTGLNAIILFDGIG